MDVDERADKDTVEKDEEDFTISKPISEPDVTEITGSDKSPEWVEWRESEPASQSDTLPNGEILESEAKPEETKPDSADTPNADGGDELTQSAKVVEGNQSTVEDEEGDKDPSKATECEEKN